MLRSVVDRAQVKPDRLPHLIGPREFDFKSPASAIVTQAANLNIRYWLTFDGQRFNAVDTITHPIPTGGAPMEVTIHVSVDICLDLKETTLRRTGGLVCASGL